MVIYLLIAAMLSGPADSPAIALAQARALTAQRLPLSATARLVEVLLDPESSAANLGAALDLFPSSLRGAPAPFAVLQALDADPPTVLEGLEPRHRSALWFLVGQSLLAHGQVERGVSRLAQVAPGSPHSPAALYLRGVAAVSGAKPRLRSAGRLFQAAIAEAESGPQRGVAEVAEARRMALLGLGRLYFEVGNHAVALYYYRRLPPTAPEAPEAEFEAAWAHVMRDEMGRALGAVHGARSPRARHPARHELHLVAGAALLGLCQMARAQAELDLLESRYLEPLAGLGRTLESFEDGDPALLIAPGSPLPKAAAALLRDQPEVHGAQRMLRRVAAEADRLRGLGAVTPPVDVAAAEARLGALRALAQVRLRRAVRVAGARLVADQQRLAGQRGELLVDVLEDEGARLAAEIEAAQDTDRPAALPTAPVLTFGADWQRWAFDGQPWPDELGSYRSTLPSLCTKDPTPEVP